MSSLKLIYLTILATFSVIIFSCENKPKLPAEARIEVPIVINRFDKDLFSIDTANLDAGLDALARKYPDFFSGYLNAILGIQPQSLQATDAIKAFLSSYYPVYQEATPIADNYLPEIIPQFEIGLQWLRYLVPAFKPDSPFVVTTFIGPMDAFESFSVGDYGDVRTANGVGVALQFHLGEQAQVYNQGIQSGLFFNYQVRRFTPETILVNAMKNVVDDLFPYTSAGKNLMAEMVDKGKRIYVLKRILPQVADSLLIGYTGTQLKGCFENEGTIWQFFVKNDLLFSIEPSINQQYLRDGPKTPELGDASPGYIGLFVGWRIVEAFMEKNKGLSVERLMQTPANTIFQASRYKPG